MKRKMFVIILLLFICKLAGLEIAKAQNTTSTMSATQYSDTLPQNILPTNAPKENIIILQKTQTNGMNPWIIYSAYFIIPAVLAALGLFISIRRKKKLGV